MLEQCELHLDEEDVIVDYETTGGSFTTYMILLDRYVRTFVLLHLLESEAEATDSFSSPKRRRRSRSNGKWTWTRFNSGMMAKVGPFSLSLALIMILSFSREPL